MKIEARVLQGIMCTTPVSTPRYCSLTPSPAARHPSDSAWQRAARHLNSTLHGQPPVLFHVAVAYDTKIRSCHSRQPQDGSLRLALYVGSNGVSTLTCEQSIEAESPAACQTLYALRSHSKPPPGFGANPDPVAEKAAREAHAKTTGPLKKRLKVQPSTERYSRAI